jgi:uncharacterized membrane protein
MQNPDEAAHFYRAEQVSKLVLAGQVIPDGEFGGIISAGPRELDRRTEILRFHTERKATRSMSAPVAWGGAVPAGFPNTAVNPPFFYVPAALMVALTQSTGVMLPHALILMRLATGFATVSIAATAIALAGDASLWLFAILLLPMSMALSAAVSQDGPMLAATALAVALYTRLRQPSLAHQGLVFASMCVLLTMVGMARVPYYAFALLALAAPVKRTWRILGGICITFCVVAWSTRSAVHFPLPPRQDGIVSPGLQVLGLATHPWRLPLLVVRTLRANDWLITRSFIGVLGSLDTDLPRAYRRLAWTGLVLAALAVWRLAPLRVLPKTMIMETFVVLGAVCGVALIQYMTWTVVGNPIIDGIQGRYFLAPAAVLGVLLCHGTSAHRFWQRWLALPVLALPGISIAVTVRALITRYYF